jgi:hypothetical protein
MVIRHVGVISAAKIAGLLYAVAGLFVGVIFAAISFLGGAGAIGAGSDASNPMVPMLGMMFGAGALILAPVFYGIMGVVIGALTAAVYNLVAGVTGGLELDVQ